MDYVVHSVEFRDTAPSGALRSVSVGRQDVCHKGRCSHEYLARTKGCGPHLLAARAALVARNACRKPSSMALIETCFKPEHVASIEAISVVFAAVLVWLSAVIQNLSNASERGAKFVMSDRSVPAPLQGSLVALRERLLTISSLP